MEDEVDPTVHRDVLRHVGQNEGVGAAVEVRPPAGEEVVHADDVEATAGQLVGDPGAQEAGSSGDDSAARHGPPVALPERRKTPAAGHGAEPPRVTPTPVPGARPGPVARRRRWS